LKGFRKNIKIKNQKIGDERRQEMLDDITNKGTFIPKGVMLEDLDKSFVEFVEKDLSIVVDGEKVPVIFLTLQRWAEFSRTWQHSDKFKNIKIPFITVIRKPDVQQGTNYAGLFNIPGKRTYHYMKVPTWDGNRKGVDMYKIPQPTSVDVNYEVRFFCNKMRDLNTLNHTIHETFKARQFYITPNGHPMPIILETIGDESPIDDFENRRYFIQLYELKLLAYTLDENEFEVRPAINRALIVMEVSEKIAKPIIKVRADKFDSLVTYTIVIKPNSETSFSDISEYDIRFNDITNQEYINSITLYVDGVVQSLPFIIRAGQLLGVSVNKSALATSKFQLNGNLL
jgi:hypothetical protein